MNEKVTDMIALLFRDIQPTEEVQALHDEVLNNCQDRFADLIRSGLSEEEALSAVMESLKGMDEVLQEYPRKQDIYAGLNLDEDTVENDTEKDTPEKKAPTLEHFNPEDIKVIEANLTSCEVEVISSDGEFSLKTEGNIFSRLDLDGTLRLWQERAAENLFKGIAWEKSFDSFESFGDAMSKLGQNISRLVNRSFNISRNDGMVDIEMLENRILLCIPADIHPEVRIRTTSGEITWEDVVPGTGFTLGSTSGDIRVEIDHSYLLPHAEISTTSGDIELRLSAEEARINTVSGDLTWEGDAGVLDLASTSGDVEAVGRVPELRMNSTSGDLHLDLTSAEASHIVMNTVSGDVEMRLPSSVQEISAAMNSRSGSLRTRGIDLVEDAAIRFEANSVSGDVKIHN